MKVKSIKTIRQVHGDNILFINNEHDLQKLVEADAIITDVPNIAIGVKTADCVPILLATEDQRLVAAIHSGWRSCILGIVTKTIQQMKYKNSSPIRAWIGPAIQKKSYIVGEELKQQFLNDNPDNNIFFHLNKNNLYFDLPNLVAKNIKDLGVKIEYMSRLDTFSSLTYPSYRRSLKFPIIEQLRSLSLISITS